MYQLFIDESGKNTLSNIESYSPHFAVGGVVIHENSKNFIKERAQQIKFKYWGSRNGVVFRANDIRRKCGHFSIFDNNPDLENQFQTDLIEYIERANFRLIWVGINKNRWVQNNPPINNAIKNCYKTLTTTFEKKLTKMLFNEAFKIFLNFLAKKEYWGQIIMEASDKKQDEDILAAYNGLLFSNQMTIQIRKHLTSISFVTKNNRDEEAQLADLGAHFLTLDARIAENVGYGGITNFDERMINALKDKQFNLKLKNGYQINSYKLL